MSEWLRPILGAALLLAGAAGLAYKVISGYQHPSPDAFISVHDQNRVPAASAAEKPAPTATVPVEVAAPTQDAALASKDAAPAAHAAASPAQSAATAAQTAPITAAAPPAASGNASAIASSAASNVALHAEALDDPACVPIKAEQAEIQGALKRQYSPEQGRFMQRRLRELTEQSGKFKCSE